MSFEPTAIAGAVLVELERHVDERGFFARSWCADEFAAAGLPQRDGRSAASRGTSSGTPCAACTGRPRPTARASWCAARGARSTTSSSTSGPSRRPTCEHVAVELDEENRRALFVPAGLAHGFLTLVDGTEVFYQMDTVARSGRGRGARWDDPAFAIEWPAPPAVISDRDRTYPDFVPERQPWGARHGRERAGANGRPAGARCGHVRAHGATSSRSAAASPVPGCATRSTGSARSCRSSSPRCRPGRQAFDWTVPKEWNVRDAWVADARGRRVIDFQQSNLHVVNYSAPVRRRLTLDELRPHLHTLPEHPTLGAVPHVLLRRELGLLPQPGRSSTACRTASTRRSSTPRSSDGSLTYGECVLPGASTDEILISSHVCHPSLANDNLSGVVVAAYLAQVAGPGRPAVHVPLPVRARARSARSSGCRRNEDLLERIRAGLVLACVGDAGPGRLQAQPAGRHARSTGPPRTSSRTAAAGDEVIDFSPYGNDERQFCSPGFDLPVGAITRSGHDRSVRHHTSADDLASIDPDRAGRHARHLPGDPRRARGRRHARQPATPRASRSSAGAASTDPSAVGPSRRRSSRRCSG